MALEKVILLRGGDFADIVILEDKKAGDSGIMPGMLLQVRANDEVIRAAVDLAKPVSYALERDEVGKGIDDPYLIGDTVKRVNHHSGMELNLILAASQTIAVDALLTSTGNGTVHAAAGTASDRIIGRAAEAVSTGAGENKRIAVTLE